MTSGEASARPSCGELELLAPGHQNCGERAAESFVGGLCERLERVRKRERLTEQRGDPKERLLPVDPLLVLAEQLRHSHRQSDLPGHRLGQRDLFVAPGPRGVAVQSEDSDQLVEDHDRNGKDRTRAEAEHRVAAAERNIVELRRRLDILERDGLAPRHREVRDGKVSSGLDRSQSRPLPLRGRNLTLSAEADQTPVDAQRVAGLLHRDAQQLVDVELRANAGRDSRDEALAFERLGQIGRRSRTIERKRRVA